MQWKKNIDRFVAEDVTICKVSKEWIVWIYETISSRWRYGFYDDRLTISQPSAHIIYGCYCEEIYMNATSIHMQEEKLNWKFRFHRSKCKESKLIEKKKINVKSSVLSLSCIKHTHRLWFWNASIRSIRSVQTLSRWIIRDLEHLSNFVWTFTTHHIGYGFTANSK